MKKNYLAPEAELLAFASEDVITSSGILNAWHTPTVDLGNSGGFAWETDSEEDMTFSVRKF